MRGSIKYLNIIEMAQSTSSRTNKGQDVHVKYEDEQAQQQPKKSKEQPKRQQRKQVEKQQEENPLMSIKKHQKHQINRRKQKQELLI